MKMLKSGSDPFQSIFGSNMFQRSPKNGFFREGYVKLGSLFRLFEKAENLPNK
jgi:hypothetical protein